MSRFALRRLTIPPSLPPAGYVQVYCDDASGQLFSVEADGSLRGLGMKANLSKSVSIELPTNAEDITLFYVPNAITLTAIQAVILGDTSPDITWTLRHSSDRSSSGNEVVTGGTTTASTTGGETITTFDDPTIEAGSFVWLETTSKNGNVDSLTLTLFYTED